MLQRSLFSAILTLLLAACVQREYLIADATGHRRAIVGARYTNNVSYITSIQVIPLYIDPAYAPDERREILRAVADWNHVLNGYVRFEASTRIFHIDQGRHTEGVRLDSTPPRTNVWVIIPAKGGAPFGERGMTAAGLTLPRPNGGGVLMTSPFLANVSTLAGVVRHELGHVLGLPHDPASRLMSPQFDPTGQQCVDKAAVAAIAEMRRLPLFELNWCERIDDAGQAHP